MPVIELINRRFVPYYFNRSGHGMGGNAEASAFTKDKTKNPYAYLAAFAHDGTYLGESELYADKRQARDWLSKILRDNATLATWTQGELTIKARGMSNKASVREQLALARLYEGLNDRPAALAMLKKIGNRGKLEERAEVARAALRVQRDTGAWSQHAKTIQALREGEAHLREVLAADLDAESMYSLVHESKHKDALALGRRVIHAHGDSPRASDLHFALGVASWFVGQRDWARFHWMWIWHERRQSRLAMRAKIAGVHETMPYANPELGGSEYKGNIGPHHIEQAHQTSCLLYKKLRPRYDRRLWTDDTPAVTSPNVTNPNVTNPKGAPTGPTSSGPSSARPTSAGPTSGATQEGPSGDPPHDAVLLAKQLRDGNRYVADNNVLVEKLVRIGVPSIASLVAVLKDELFLGRGYAGYALGKVMGATKSYPLAAKMTLVRGLQNSNSYVSALTKSGADAAGLSWETLADARRAVAEEDAKKLKASGAVVPWQGNDPTVLAKRLVDGNSHRVTNNRIVARLAALGDASVAPLIALLADTSFQGRGYAAIALARVVKPLKNRHAEAIGALEKNASSSDRYIRALTQSALSSLKR